MTLAAERLTVRLGGRRVVEDVTVALGAGALVAVLGPNGAGKSTLLRALLGLVPGEGRVLVDGRPIAHWTRPALARRIAYLPQGQRLHWPLSVERLVTLGRLPHLAPLSRTGPADRAAVERAMALADILHLAGRTATELSGGERARALLARALAVEAPAMLVDEPLASLDPDHQLQVMEILRAQADDGALVLAVLHDLNLALRFADRALVLQGGRLVADGPPQRVLTAELLADVYRVSAFAGTADLPLLVPIARLR